jgi:membrane fusion protein (multidrug efflux system)
MRRAKLNGVFAAGHNSVNLDGKGYFVASLACHGELAWPAPINDQAIEIDTAIKRGLRRISGVTHVLASGMLRLARREQDGDAVSEDDGGKQGDRREAKGDESGDDGKKGDKDESDDKKKKDSKPKSRWPLVVLAIVVILAIIGGVVYWVMTRDLESTDDAYTEGNAISIAPKVAGYVIERDVEDNSYVHAGDIMLKIDPRDYIAARDEAAANLTLAKAQALSAQVDLDITRVRAPANLKQAEAQLAQARANQMLASRTYHRERSVDQRATTQTSVDQADAQFQSNNASVNSAQAQVQVAALVRQTIEADEDTVKQRRAQVEQAQANLAQAEINLSYCILRAPQDGHITRRNVDVGTYLQAGQQVFFIVTPALWITANFKETQLNRMRPGQPVDITVDAYPALNLHGHVDSIQAGSGDRFSTFPAENATGNYVKIVRRVPVKIIIDSGIDKRVGLPLGLSVTPTVTVQ